MPNEADWKQDYGGHFPGSSKIYIEKDGVRVPMREIELSKGNQPLQVYDTSGPLGIPPKEGLPALRASWIEERQDTQECERIMELSDKTPTSLHRKTRKACEGKNVSLSSSEDDFMALLSFDFFRVFLWEPRFVHTAVSS